MKKESAIQIQKCALEAIESLSKITFIDENKYEEYAQIKKGAGMSIGKIQMDILEVINRLYPELDDLK